MTNVCLVMLGVLFLGPLLRIYFRGTISPRFVFFMIRVIAVTSIVAAVRATFQSMYLMCLIMDNWSNENVPETHHFQMISCYLIWINPRDFERTGLYSSIFIVIFTVFFFQIQNNLFCTIFKCDQLKSHCENFLTRFLNVNFE